MAEGLRSASEDDNRVTSDTVDKIDALENPTVVYGAKKYNWLSHVLK